MTNLIKKKHIRVNGVGITCYCAGDGNDTIVLLHGAGVDSAMLSWAGVIPLLSDQYQVIAPDLPVKVLGLIHLRNTIRVYRSIDASVPLRLTVHFDTMRLTDAGQEYDFTTRYERNGQLVWEEVSTMFARGTTPMKTEGGKRPSIERSLHPKEGAHTETLEIRENTGWRYARVSGDFNPIHLTARTAAMYGFKQAVAHGMWSLGRCLGAAATHLPAEGIQVDTQFKLPVYLPSQALARVWPVEGGWDISMSTMRGDRLHLAMQVRRL